MRWSNQSAVTTCTMRVPCLAFIQSPAHLPHCQMFLAPELPERLLCTHPERAARTLLHSNGPVHSAVDLLLLFSFVWMLNV